MEGNITILKISENKHISNYNTWSNKMDIFTRALKSRIKGEYLVHLESGKKVFIINPNLDETIIIEEATAREYNRLLLSGLPSVEEVSKNIKKDIKSLGIDENILENKNEIFLPLIENEEYNILLASVNEINIKTFKEKMSELIEKLVDKEKLKTLKKAEVVYEKHYRKTADYFSYFVKMKMLIFYSLYLADNEINEKSKKRYFNSLESISNAEPDFLEEIIFYIKEFLLSGGRESFFLH